MTELSEIIDIIESLKNIKRDIDYEANTNPGESNKFKNKLKTTSLSLKISIQLLREAKQYYKKQKNINDN